MLHTRFFEAHDTGTAVGDPVEIMAIENAFRDYRSFKKPLYVRAVKTNIGHLEGASGIAGLIKAILVLKSGIISSNTNFERANLKIDTEYSRILFLMQPIPWPCGGLRRASVNSFKFGGSNSHVILDDAFNYLTARNLPGHHKTVSKPPQDMEEEYIPHSSVNHQCLRYSRLHERNNGVIGMPKLLVWSATDAAGLDRLAVSYQNYFSALPLELVDCKLFMNDLSYTLDSHRSSLPWKSYVVVDSLAEIKDLKTQISTPVISEAVPPRLAFVFSGQGAQ